MENELAKRVYYVSSEIQEFQLVRGGDADFVVGVEITTDREMDPVELGRKLGVVVRRDVLPQASLPEASVVWRSPEEPAPARVEFSELERAGIVVRMGEGAFATGELFTDLLARLDDRIRRIAVDQFSALSYRYPTLVSTEVLRKAGYLDSFPQFLMTASRFHSDTDAYQDFASGLATADHQSNFIDSFSEHSGYCLPPTMCYHTYHQYTGQEIGATGAVVTSRGKSFRFESRYHHSLERLWDFTIREIVFLGSRETVVEERQKFMDAACALMTELRLAGHVEVANDPFFSNEMTAERVMVQRVLEMKYELRLPVAGGRTAAVGSFNIHGSNFGEAFGMTLPTGGPAHSACVGFGLERLAYAFLCRHGADPADWPAF
ncbi:hypothetical protein ACFTTN_23820 [Streptomyces niveus]|uniref:hypothetical protein n=1 Tax=Streptomyces niveus TaxID=193462 RepID=UPI0036451721